MKYIHLKYRIQWVLQMWTLIDKCNHQHNRDVDFHQVSSLFKSLWKLHCHPWPAFCHYRPFSRVSYQGNHTVCNLLCLPPFTEQNVFKIHVYWVYENFIPICCWVIFHCMVYLFGLFHHLLLDNWVVCNFWL